MKYIKFSLVILVLSFALYFSGAQAQETILSVGKISIGSETGYVIYWPVGLGTAKIERSSDNVNFQSIGQTESDHFVDSDADKSVKSYTYRVVVGGQTLIASSSNADSEGRAEISNISVDSGSANKSEASVVVHFKTDKLAKSQVAYGELAGSYSAETELIDSLNQSHTVLIEGLKPNATYHLKVKTFDRNSQNPSESEDYAFTTPFPPADQSILQIIIQALTSAFAGFEKWLRS